MYSFTIYKVGLIINAVLLSSFSWNTELFSKTTFITIHSINDNITSEFSIQDKILSISKSPFLSIVPFANLSFDFESHLKKDIEQEDCLEPLDGVFKSIATSIALSEPTQKEYEDLFMYGWEVRIWKMSCAEPGKDSLDVAKVKIRKMWEKYKKKFKADSAGFSVPNGNILKFSLEKGFTNFIETMVTEYGVDINFVDPADGRNVLDYINDRIVEEQKKIDSVIKLEILKKQQYLLLKLGAKPSK